MNSFVLRILFWFRFCIPATRSAPPPLLSLPSSSPLSLYLSSSVCHSLSGVPYRFQCPHSHIASQSVSTHHHHHHHPISSAIYLLPLFSTLSTQIKHKIGRGRHNEQLPQCHTNTPQWSPDIIKWAKHVGTYDTSFHNTVIDNHTSARGIMGLMQPKVYKGLHF